MKLISRLTQTRFAIGSQLITRMAFTMEGTRVVVTNLSATSCTFGTFVYVCEKSTKKLVTKTITTIRRIVAIYSHLCLKFIFLSRMLFALFCCSFKKCLQFIFYLKYRTFEIFQFLWLFFFFKVLQIKEW